MNSWLPWLVGCAALVLCIYVIFRGVLGLRKRKIAFPSRMGGYWSIDTHEGEEARGPSITLIILGALPLLALVSIGIDHIFGISWGILVTIPPAAVVAATFIVQPHIRKNGLSGNFFAILFFVCYPILVVLAAFWNENKHLVPQIPFVLTLVSLPLVFAIIHFIVKRGKAKEKKHGL